MKGDRSWEEEGDLLGLVGHAGPYFPYDIEDTSAPVKEKRAPGFVTADDYVTRGGKVKQYKRRKR